VVTQIFTGALTSTWSMIHDHFVGRSPVEVTISKDPVRASKLDNVCAAGVGYVIPKAPDLIPAPPPVFMMLVINPLLRMTSGLIALVVQTQTLHGLR
jgi:hypothetical protein